MWTPKQTNKKSGITSQSSLLLKQESHTFIPEKLVGIIFRSFEQPVSCPDIEDHRCSALPGFQDMTYKRGEELHEDYIVVLQQGIKVL